MIKFDESEIILHKALSSKILEGLLHVNSKMDHACLKITDKIEKLENQVKKSQDVKSIAVYSKQILELEAELVRILSLANRVEILISRNKQRIEYFNKILKDAGIYNESFNPKDLQKMQEEEKDNISTEMLNLNLHAEKGKVTKLVFGELLTFCDGKLDLAETSNKKVLMEFSSAEIKSLIRLYPESISTISDDAFMNVRFKQKLLKEIASYVENESKTQSIKQINEKLGNLLSFKTQITKNVADYVAGVQNMFDAIAKGKLIKEHPERAREIKRKLKCNSKSELIPAQKREAILANGMAGDVQKTEEEESEELRVSNEKDLQTQIWTDTLMQELFAAEEEQEQEEIQNALAEEQAKLEELKKLEDEKKKEEEEVMEQNSMTRMYTKHDWGELWKS